MTLAQVVRLVALSRSLRDDEFEIHFAAARFDPAIFGRERFRRWLIRSIAPSSVERAVRFGLRPWSARTLAAYVADDLRLLGAVRPDVVVADLRWSLAVSGPRSGVKVASLANAYWSPYAIREFPLPEHPVVAALGVGIARRHFPRARPAVFRWFARPLDAVREAHGLAPLRSLEQVLTWGDMTLYADPPALYAMREMPPSHRFIGPVHWAPERGSVPELRERPLIYLTLGSSGPVHVLPRIMEALTPLDVDVLLATAGRTVPRSLPANVRAVSYARGDLAAARASVVVCNGGASTAYQALTAGTPVVGLPFNLDQALAMDAIVRAGAGVLVRSGTAKVETIRDAVRLAMADPTLRAGARRASEAMRTLDAPVEFRRALDRLISGGRDEVESLIPLPASFHNR